MTTHLGFALGEPLPAGDGGEAVVVREAGTEVDDAVVGALLAALGEQPDVVAVSVRPVTDTLKIVTEEAVVVGTADREHHRFVGAPFALRLALLRSVGPARTPAEVLTALAACARLVPVGD